MKQRYPKKLLLVLLLYIISADVMAQTYAWKNVKIGAGGFVSGLVFNPAQSNQLYARTDVGGAYRWEAATNSWTPLTDFLGQDDENYSGVLSMACDPNDVNRVYMATGLYTQSWAGNGAVFSSTDKGNTWTKHNLTFKLGGNEDGRNSGERLAVDPNRGNILLLGSSKNGLWQSADYGSTWSQVSGFPLSTFTGAGVAFVLFDKSTGTPGNATQTIYVGIMQTGSANLYKSTDGGVTWSAVAVPGALTGLMPMQGVLASDGNMYITYSDAPGPNGISTGAVYKFNTSTGVWTPLTLPAGQGGYAGVNVDANDPNTLVVSTINRWWPRDEIFRSTDGGSTWTGLLGSATWDHTSAPYTAGHTAHWIADVEIDPYDTKKAWFVTGYGVYQTTDLTASPVTWTFQNNGLEEIVATALVSPATGVPLLSAVGDQDGFRHIDLDVSPVAGKHNPSYGTHTGIDVAAVNSNYVVRVYNNSSGNYGSYSTDQGVAWTMFSSYPAGTTAGGSVAVSANGNRIVWTPGGASAVYYSGNNGATWTASTGIPSGQVVVADAVNSNKFYGYNALSGVMLVSTDGGATFSNAATGLPTLQSWELWLAQASAVFGIEGDVWFTSGNNGLYHSVNSGASFTKVSGIDAAYKVAFGKAANSAPYPAIYVQGRVSGVYGFFRSIDGGSTWVRINDDAHNFLGIRAFTADPKVFGQVYLGTSGRGLIYGTDLSVLPVVFTRVSVSQRPVSQKVYADVKWQASGDDATTGYVLERSLDGVHWQEVYRTTVSGLNEYKYSDDVTAFSGNIRYRIREVNKSGYGSYSAVVTLRMSAITRTTVTVWPNPVLNNVINLHISSQAKQKVVVRLTDVNGQTLYTSVVVPVEMGENVINIPATMLAKRRICFAEVLNADNGSKITVIKVIL